MSGDWSTGAAQTQPDFSGRYNTLLAPNDETQFQAWMQQRSAATGRNVANDLYDYDLRGAWLSNAQAAANGHLPDTFKKPNHPTFSNQSQYSGVDENVGGAWGGTEGAWTYDPSATNLQFMGVEGLKKYFQDVEPDSKLLLQTTAAQGRGNDSMLAHISPREAGILQATGGSGTINPSTGLPEFTDVPIQQTEDHAGLGDLMKLHQTLAETHGMIQQMAQQQAESEQRLTEALAMVARHIGAPRRVVRDESGRVSGVEMAGADEHGPAFPGYFP